MERGLDGAFGLLEAGVVKEGHWMRGFGVGRLEWSSHFCCFVHMYLLDGRLPWEQPSLV